MNDPSAPKDQEMSSEQMRRTGDESGTYLYEPAGILERSGSVPTWLKVMALGLILWGVYYTVRFWSSD